MKREELLNFVKRRCSIRKYKNKSLPEAILSKIIEAGIWGPSVPSFLRIQPWRFVVVRNKIVISKLSEIISKKSQKAPAGVNILLKAASNIVRNAQVIIAIYKTDDMEIAKRKYKELAANFGDLLNKAQLCAISASIQNMVIVAGGMNIGSCWLDMPLLCEKDINKVFKTKKQLVAFLTLGYPAEKGRRAARKSASESVEYIK